MPNPSPLPNAGRRSSAQEPCDGHHVLAAAVFVVAWLLFVAFVALYRAPLPTDAFAALTVEWVARADVAATR
jgi:hypothetical protein